MRLLTFQPHVGLPLPGLRPGNLITFEPGKGPYGDWRVHVRGPSVYLVSPPGWGPGLVPANYKGTDRRIYEVPRTHCYLGWVATPSDKTLDTRDWSPPCESCGNALTLADVSICVTCRDGDKPQLAEAADQTPLPPASGAMAALIERETAAAEEALAKMDERMTAGARGEAFYRSNENENDDGPIIGLNGAVIQQDEVDDAVARGILPPREPAVDKPKGKRR